MPEFNLHQFFIDVFAPTPGERVAVLFDLPHDSILDHPKWRDRRAMAHEWAAAICELTGNASLFCYLATGAHNADLPVDIARELECYRLALALTEFSATAPLIKHAQRYPLFRAASMPGIERRMERSGLAADYKEIRRRCGILVLLMDNAVAARVLFATGDVAQFDLRLNAQRSNISKADDGYLHPDKEGLRLVNLPAGEVYRVPYEGDDSTTQGVIPIRWQGGEARLVVEHNRIVDVVGDGAEAQALASYFALDPARRNIAEFAFGCNPCAEVTGVVLEDEKAGFHFAWGRSDHLGGTVGVAQFADPRHVVHHDVVYAKGNPIQVRQAVLTDAAGQETIVIQDGDYTVF